MAAGWDSLTPRHRQEIVDHVKGTMAVLNSVSATLIASGTLEDICRYAIDGLGRSTPLEDEYQRGFEDGQAHGFDLGRANAARRSG